MKNDNTLISDDWAKNWEGSIAVKVAAVVLWMMIAISFGTIVLLLNNTKNDIENTTEWNGERLAAYVGQLVSQSPTPTISEIENQLATKIETFGFPAIDLTIGDLKLQLGKYSDDMETHYLRELFTMYQSENGISNKILLRPYRYPTNKLVKDTRNIMVISVLAALMLFGVLLTWIINKIVTKPIHNLLHATQQVSKGNMDTRLAVDRNDEFGQLANFFNQMLENLDEQRKELIVALQQAESATETKSAFLANMSHEIRTPLTAIIGYAEVLKHSERSIPDNMEEIKTIIRNGEHLLKIINNILDLSKIEANSMEIENAPVNLMEIISDIKSIVEPQTKEKALSFNVNYKYPLPKIILSEPLRLKQILLNLCSNAVKFTDSGSITVSMSCDCENESVTIQVADTGIGMNKEQLQRVFKAFSQADSSTTRKYGGTGLGLYLSKQLTDALGGELAVESKVNEGSCFSLTVNTGQLNFVEFINEDSSEPEVRPDPSMPLQVNTVNGCILLVEDSLDNQRLISLYLSKMGASVTLADNGKIAIQKAMDKHFDLILMDVQMPVMGGLEAVEYLRKNKYKGPIAALTANAMNEDRKKCFAAGCDDFVSKPVNREALYATVKKYLDKKNTNQDHENEQPIISELYKEDPSTLEIIRQFVKNLPGLINRIKLAQNEKRWEELAATNHELKGVGGGYGYPELSLLALNIENELNSNNYSEVEKLIQRIDSLIIRINKGLTNLETASINMHAQR